MKWPKTWVDAATTALEGLWNTHYKPARTGGAPSQPSTLRQTSVCFFFSFLFVNLKHIQIFKPLQTTENRSAFDSDDEEEDDICDDALTNWLHTPIIGGATARDPIHWWMKVFPKEKERSWNPSLAALQRMALDILSCPGII